jgi:hypothetical protein
LRVAFLWLALLALASASPAAAAIRLFSYDPADAATRASSGALTFQFRQTLTFIRVQNVRATEGEAKAELRPADQGSLGPGGLGRVIGDAPERDLYEVLPTDEGDALTKALCPGSRHAWMAFGHLRANANLRVFVLGDNPKTGQARRCQTLAFSFHGEWKLHDDRPFDQRLVDRPLVPH